jgi:hypothetical protein
MSKQDFSFLWAECGEQTLRDDNTAWRTGSGIGDWLIGLENGQAKAFSPSDRLSTSGEDQPDADDDSQAQYGR